MDEPRQLAESTWTANRATCATLADSSLRDSAHRTAEYHGWIPPFVTAAARLVRAGLYGKITVRACEDAAVALFSAYLLLGKTG